MSILRKFLIIFLLGLLVLTANQAIFIEPDQLIVKRVSLTVPHWDDKLENAKFIILADIHAGAPFIDRKKLKEIVNIVNKEKPDFIFLLGDYLIKNVLGGNSIKAEIIAEELGKLKASKKIIAVLGNHDWWCGGEEVWQSFEKANIVVLENNSIKVNYNNKSFWVSGLADLVTRKPDLNKTFKDIKDKDPIILLTHVPDMFPSIPQKVSLTLAGHTHGGQVTLPFVGSLIVPSEYGQRYAEGHIVENDKHLFVSSGIGTSILPVRLGNPPEIVVLTLKNK